MLAERWSLNFLIANFSMMLETKFWLETYRQLYYLSGSRLYLFSRGVACAILNAVGKSASSGNSLMGEIDGTKLWAQALMIQVGITSSWQDLHSDFQMISNVLLLFKAGNDVEVLGGFLGWKVVIFILLFQKILKPLPFLSCNGDEGVLEKTTSDQVIHPSEKFFRIPFLFYNVLMDECLLGFHNCLMSTTGS